MLFAFVNRLLHDDSGVARVGLPYIAIALGMIVSFA